MYTAATILLLFFTALTAWVTVALVFKLEAVDERPSIFRSWRNWFARGFALPALIWTLMNLGLPWLSWRLQPFAPAVQAAQRSGKTWFPIFATVCAAGFFVIATFWCAVTVIWSLGKALKKMDEPARIEFWGICLAGGLGLALPALFILWAGGRSASGLALDVIAVPIAFYATPLLNKRPTASYSRAIARMKMGKYAEAEQEIIRQLETCENDYDGWMMMAELYANQFHDLDEASKTIIEVCQQPNITPSQYSIALHRLADWQLSMGGDPDGARRSLQMICDHLSGTHLATMAALRLKRLPLTADTLKRQSTPEAIRLPALGNAYDEPDKEPENEADSQAYAAEAKECVERLTAEPNDVVERERLARLLAERLRRPDLAIEQINLLMGIPNQSDMRRAEWLGLAASWHIKYLHDADAARLTLERICREFPETPQAMLAGARLQKLARRGAAK
jgi:hypothetical protein